jgi:Putative zinc-finger
VRCSLLALSSYLDAELGIEPTGEIEAHLLACDRCRTAIGHLREESQRIGGLTRVHIPDGAVHELFSQIGLIEEGDELPVAPPHLERQVGVEAPPWFGAERGKALPWASRPSHDAAEASEPRELIGGRSPSTAVADPPELLLWDEPLDQIVTSTIPPSPSPPPLHKVREPERLKPVEPVRATAPTVEPPVAVPQPPEVLTAAPQPPALGYADPQPPQPYTSGAPTAFQRMRDAIAVRIALRRGGGSHLDSSVEIVSGAGAPTWNQRAHPKAWSDSPSVVVDPDPPAVEHAVPPVVTRPDEHEFVGTRDAAPVVPDRPPTVDAPIATPELADVLGEVATLAAPLGRATAPVPDVAPREAPKHSHVSIPDPTPKRVEMPIEDEDPVADAASVADAAPEDTLAAVDALVSPEPFRPEREPSVPAGPGRHVRRLKSQKPERRSWNPAQPVTGRHVLPIGGPAVAAADRDRTLWIFGGITAVVMVLGLLIGRQVTPSRLTAPATIHRPVPSAHATAPAVTAAPLPIATPVPAVTLPAAPTPQQLTGVHNLGTGSGGFSVADVRIGEHLNDFRLVFDLAFPDSVTGSPATVIGYDGPTTIYVEFTGVLGTSPIQSMPPGQVVVSVVPLPMVRNTERLIFKITLSKNAPFDAYYLSGGRLIIDVT